MLLLPPRLPAGASDAVRAAAEVACDRLAQDLAAAGSAQVVDRSQLDRILQERNLQAEPLRPMLSYDAMIRLEADTTRLAPQTTLGLIDLSTGSIIAQRAFAWPPDAAAAKAMLDFCRDSLKHLVKPAAGKLRVRTLWAAEAIANERIRPLGRRLIDLFEQSLRQSERVLVVRHLEAATSKEESLLLLLGLSRLPGGRQFTPQADATIELRVVESDGRGKTFPETPVEIGVRLRKGAAYQGDWVTTAGLVRDFDSLTAQAWHKLAQSLGEVRPETAATLLNEMSLRRKQAEAELRTVTELRKSPHSGPNDLARTLMAALLHAEAAIKLDPTYPEAVRLYIQILAGLDACDYQGRRMPEASLRSLREAARYVEVFRQDSALCRDLCSYALPGRGLLRMFWDPESYDDPVPPLTNARLTLAPELVQALDAVKRLLERGVEDDVKFRFNTAEWTLVPVFRGMKLMDVPAAQRQAWLETIAARCLEKVKRGTARAIEPTDDWQDCIHLQVRTAELLIEDGQMEPARRIMGRAQSEFPPAYSATAYSVSNLMRAVVQKANDAQLSAAFHAWTQRGEKTKVHLIYIDWPSVDLYARPKSLASARPATGSSSANQDACAALSSSPIVPYYGGDHPGPKMPVISAGGRGNYRPLSDGDGRLYFLTDSPLRIAYVPLDAQGRPTGKAVRSPSRFGVNVWDAIKDISQPDWKDAPCWVTSARYWGGKLYVGTHRRGLQVFDPKTETWKGYGPEQGLPSRDVDEFFPIGGQALYCNTQRTHYTLNLADGAVTLVHRADLRTWEKDWLVDWNLLLAWRDGQRVVAVDRSGVWDNLLSEARKRTPLPGPRCYGWRTDNLSRPDVFGAVETGGRRFCVCRGGLYEFDAAGTMKLLCAWETTEYWLHVAGWQVVAPADCPLPDFDVVCATRSHLVFTDHRYLTIYDIDRDTWYGPVTLGLGNRPLTPLATTQGMLWGTSGDGLTYLALDDVVAYAKSLGRAMATAEYRRRAQQFIDAAKPLDRAKFALGMRQFGKAKSALQQVLDAEPDQPEALLLMGFLHVRDCLNQPAEALKYYRRAAELENNPVASYSGMFFSVHVLMDCRQWKEASELCQTIWQRYPGLAEFDRQSIQRLCDESRRQLAQKDAKQPAAGKPDREQGPAK